MTQAPSQSPTDTTQEISLLGQRVQLKAPKNGFRPGLDSVMLAAACPAKAGDHVLDLGCGIGSAGFCVLARVPEIRLTGIDIQENYIALAKENAELNAAKVNPASQSAKQPSSDNGISDNDDNSDTASTASTASTAKNNNCNSNITSPNSNSDNLNSLNITSSNKSIPHTIFHHAPISYYVKLNKEHKAILPNGAELPIGVDHVICNPPFLNEAAHTPSPDKSRAMANGHMDDTTLEDWIKAAFNALKSGGTLTMIHRADHTDQIIRLLSKSFGATEIIPLWPKANTPAKRVIIRTIKHRKSPSTLHPGIILHEKGGSYTKEAENILRNAKSL